MQAPDLVQDLQICAYIFHMKILCLLTLTLSTRFLNYSHSEQQKKRFYFVLLVYPIATLPLSTYVRHSPEIFMKG